MSAVNKNSRWGQDTKAVIRSKILESRPREYVYKRNSRKRAFESFCKARKYKINRDTSIVKLAEILEDYAFNMRRLDGEEFKESSVKCYWDTTAATLQKQFFEEFGKAFDPFHDREFARARAARDGKRKILQADPSKRVKRSGEFSQEEYTKMVQSYDPETPNGLMKRVFLLLYKDLAWTTKEAFATLENFVEVIENDGTPSGILKFNPLFSKTYSGGARPLATDKWVIPNNDDHSMCPVRLYKKMFSLRPPDAPNKVFLLPNLHWQRSRKSQWFTKKPVGESMRSWVKEAAERIGLKGHFTNQSARYSAVAHLASAEVPPHLAMRMTGHRNIKSLKPYASLQKEEAQKIIARLRSEEDEPTD